MKKRAILLCVFYSPCFAIEIEKKSSIFTSSSNENRICHTDIPQVKAEPKKTYFCDECCPEDFEIPSLISKKENEKNEQLVTGFTRRHSDQNIPKVLIQMCCDFSRKYPACQHVHEYLKKQLANKERRNAEDHMVEVMAIYNLEAAVKDDEYLYLVAFSKMSRVLEVFVAYGCNLNRGYRKGNTLLHIAAERNSKEVAALLIKYGANVNIENCIHETPLHRAAVCNSKEIAALLIQANADVNASPQGIFGCTPLHFAAIYNNEKIVQLLIEANADVNAKDNSEHTPLYWVKLDKNKAMTRYLKSVGAKAPNRFSRFFHSCSIFKKIRKK